MTLNPSAKNLCLLLVASLLVAGPALGASGSDDPILAGLDDHDAPSAHRAFGDFSLSHDRVTGLPGGRQLTRQRARLRAGWRGEGERFEYAVAIKAGVGTDDNADNRRNNDNERSNGAGLDEAWLRWNVSDHTAIALGQRRFPLQLTPMVWDDDLRPIGMSLEHAWPVGDFDRVRLVAGHFAGNHLYDDRSRISALQLGWHYREGAPLSADVQVGYLDFDRLERLTAEGLARSNRRVGNQLVSDYRLLDLQLGLRWELASGPLSLRANLVRNLGADDLDTGGRVSLVHGLADARGGSEFGFSYQRIQRDAVMAAFNADAWWFHSAVRGAMPWIAYGWQNGWVLQVSSFHERLDNLDKRTDRLLAELRYHF